MSIQSPGAGFRCRDARSWTTRIYDNLGAAAPPAACREQRDANTLALERELSTVLGLRVTLDTKKHRGAMTIHYANLDQLDRVLRQLRTR